jgi:ATP-dependent Clp protease ATP-binding subunit ClpA
MFERFTEPGIKVVVTAQEEARKIGNNFVGTEQILLGLIAETSGIGGRVLRKYGVTLRLAREELNVLLDVDLVLLLLKYLLHQERDVFLKMQSKNPKA